MASDPFESRPVNRRGFGLTAASSLIVGASAGGITALGTGGSAAWGADLLFQESSNPQDATDQSGAKSQQEPANPTPAKPEGPTEAAFERDYEPPQFKPNWSKPQINRQLIADFVIFAHSELDQVKMLLERYPNLVNAAMDWGDGDWETALGGASHMGRVDIVEHLISHGARMDLFCAAMLGQLEIVKAALAWQPALIDARGPHGFSLHFHAQVGGEPAQPVLDLLQSLKRLELKPVRLRRSDLPKAPDR